MKEKQKQISSFFTPFTFESNKEFKAQLFDAIKQGNLLNIKGIIMQMPQNIELKDLHHDKFSILTYCANYDKTGEITKFFIQLGLDVNKHDKHHDTPLITAIRDEKNYQTIRVLLEYKADPTIIANSKKVFRYTPLVWMCNQLSWIKKEDRETYFDSLKQLIKVRRQYPNFKKDLTGAKKEIAKNQNEGLHSKLHKPILEILNEELNTLEKNTSCQKKLS